MVPPKCKAMCQPPGTLRPKDTKNWYSIGDPQLCANQYVTRDAMEEEKTNNWENQKESWGWEHQKEKVKEDKDSER